ncbi:hypothetical protein LOC71_10930 [Rhodopirellula sp. JC740]|uniref:CsbD-like domain-containing protein n=2 Tax=Rhodopirellula halodulae TaxID=2894198 RepID=A0ABS8NHA9_9BACT|nr:hypothetical protein [Rhodopirellula sp. JC740]
MMSTELKEVEGMQWVRVRDAIQKRWPEINKQELAQCPNNLDHLTDFVSKRVGDSQEEIESVVREFAPHESLIDRISHNATDQVGRASESARFAVMRADECIAERPTQSVLASFAAGLILGVTVTALWLHQKPEPSRWERLKSQSWN